jgi:hypothetical protein
MLRSICDLTEVRPHMHKSARYTPPEHRAYAEGYYTGVISALRVADLAVSRFKLRMKTIAAETRRKRSA